MKSKPDYEPLDNYFSQLRDRVEHAEKDYPRLTSVVDGETTLVDIVNEYETRFNQLLNHKTVLLDKLRIKRLEDKVVNYTKELEQFLDVLDSISGELKYYSFASLHSSQLEKYRKQKSEELDRILYAGGAVGCFSAVLSPFFLPLLPAIPALALMFGGAAGTLVSQSKIPENIEKSGKSNAEYFFKRLGEYAGTVDKEIRSAYEVAYAIDCFIDYRDLFSEVYRELDESNRNYVRTKLMGMQELGVLKISRMELESFLEVCVKGGDGE